MEDLSRGRRPRETRRPLIHLEVHTSTKLPKGIDRPSYQVIVTPTSSIDNCRQLLEEFSNLIGRTGLLAHCSLFSLEPTGPETHLFPTIPDFLIDLYPLPKQKNMVNIAGRSRGCSTSRRRRVKCGTYGDALRSLDKSLD